jgi:hypothetical protein
MATSWCLRNGHVVQLHGQEVRGQWPWQTHLRADRVAQSAWLAQHVATLDDVTWTRQSWAREPARVHRRHSQAGGADDLHAQALRTRYPGTGRRC